MCYGTSYLASKYQQRIRDMNHFFKSTCWFRGFADAQPNHNLFCWRQRFHFPNTIGMIRLSDQINVSCWAKQNWLNYSIFELFTLLEQNLNAEQQRQSEAFYSPKSVDRTELCSKIDKSYAVMRRACTIITKKFDEIQFNPIKRENWIEKTNDKIH